MLKLAALVGPTSVGKTELSISLAQELKGEIISCDSMQVYKGMNIGTAKASIAELSMASHHLINIVDPDVIFTVADYQKLAQQEIRSITERGKIPILVGGTGLYYQAVVDDYDFFPIESKEAVRCKWEQACLENGIDYLYEQLLLVDREYALKIGPNDKKRMIRALEVHDLTGQAFSDFQTRNRFAYNLSVVGLFLERDQLYARIEERVDKMIADGLVEEVAELREKGYDLSLNSMKALGYKQIYCYLEGMITWQETLQDIKRETRRYAKRQYTWFNKDKRIQWINVADYSNPAILVKKIYNLMEGQLYSM
ncbi:MAG: tRNA (adenosine(37)-N6)-dimethylallyltransferase MiaA [Firmicutes bacterium HGW-Firmicutes-15]|nr:MAG: tRNA (adenosine(37)-N6)-dimethylallyltransferase MiaA [Firmicutes bacterium HGW-Firmicutes-15]